MALFCREGYDVALVDLMLPGIDGLEVIRRLRHSSDVPIVIVTAKDDTDDVIAGLEAGADDYVTKPLVAKELSARIGALLRRSDLLEISKMDAGAAELAMEETELGEFLRFATTSHGAGTVPLEIAAGAERLVVRAEKRRLLRVVANLLDNADRHGNGALCVRLERSGSWAVLTVEDGGPGVPAEERSLVFERFYRGSGASSLRVGGSGLGLALVAEHVRVHGGTVDISDRPQGGARFTVLLPAVDPSSGDVGHDRRDRPARGLRRRHRALGPAHRPHSVPHDLLAPASTTSTVVLPAAQVTVYFEGPHGLVQVARDVNSPASVQVALTQLGNWPGPTDGGDMLQSPVSTVTPLTFKRMQGTTAYVSVPGAFANLGGQDQIVAAAQLVYTVTAVSGIDAVVLLVNGQEAQVLVAGGTLQQGPLNRANYADLLAP